VTANFSETVDPATVNSGTFTLRDPNGNTVAASVSVSGSTATLTPSAQLAGTTTYVATLTSGASGIKDLAGNALGTDYSWTFTTAAVDTTPPTVGFAFPSASAAYNLAGWTAGCPTAGLCGTAADAGWGVQTVEVSIERMSTVRWYNGSTFGATSERWLTATGTTSWSYALANLSTNASYTVKVRARDAAGNLSAPTTVAFVYDTTAPTFTVSFPKGSGSYTTTTWNAGCALSGMCGTASDALTGVKSVEISIRRGTGNYWDGSSFASASEVFFSTNGTTSWSYGFPAANFGGVKASYTIRVRATDNAGNVRSPTATKFSFTP
jgi:hypothetical protein